MTLRYPLRLTAAAAAWLLPSVALSAPVISEIMFHTAAVPENLTQEWIELHNPDPASIAVGNWKFTKGVNFTIPVGTVIPAGGQLIVAANVVTFQAAYPTVTNVVGGWIGNLSNSGETLRLVDAAGLEVDQVDYFTEGDWGTRARGPLLLGHRGWDWINAADGGGKSMELVNAALRKNNGQNWKPSTTAGGTPGAANSVAAANVAPLILAVKHRPAVPLATQPVQVSCDLADEGTGATATLHWRLDTGVWQTLPMADSDLDGEVDATIPPQANLAVVEFYISASDGSLTRTWPAPARTSDVGILPETYDQVTNALYQVDNAFNAAEDFTNLAGGPLYRIIMTDAERAELANIGSALPQAESDAAMNTTFIIQDGRGLEVHYRAGTRNRGDGSRVGPPNNFYVGFPNDDAWGGRVSAQFNCQYPHSQALGALLMEVAGIAVQEATPVRIRVNATDLAQPTGRMYGHYARIEPANGAWVKEHFPNDPDGNVYRLDDHAPNNVVPTAGADLGTGEFRYEGALASAYSDTYLKKTNEELNDYSDLAEMCKVLSAPATGGTVAQPAIPDANYVAAISAKINLDQWLTFFATDALIGNQEGGLQSGRADDVAMYRGVLDTRFIMVPHDFDAVFNLGTFSGNPITRSIFSYQTTGAAANSFDFPGPGVVGLQRLFDHPDIVPLYYAKVLEGTEKWFNHATIDPLIDRLLGGWLPPANITAIKGFIDSRRDQILGNVGLGIAPQVQQAYSLNITTAGVAIEGMKRTTDGAASFSGTFNVAKTRSIMVNGNPATFFYKTVGADNAGTWRLATPSGGGSVLHPGRNRVVVEFYEGKNGTGTLLQSLTEDVMYEATVPAYTYISGTLTSGSLRITAPASYIPGKPFLVRADVLDGAGNVDRSAWDGTVSLSSSVSGLTLPSIQIYNGTGSALVTAGGAAGLPPTVLFKYGTGGNGTAGSGVGGSSWKEKHDFTNTTLATFITTIGNTWRDEAFDHTSWNTVTSQIGYGNADENTPITDPDFIPGGASDNVPCFLFRSTFTIPDVNAITNLTGQIKYDDAYAIYVNGTDVLQRSATLPAGRALDLYATGTSVDNATAGVTIASSFLHNGVNTIAVDIRQGNSTSGDVTFDLALQANYPSADPGNFTLTGTYVGPNATFVGTKALTSLTNAPTMTTVAANTTLPAGVTTWSGVVNVLGNVTVPAGATLNISAGTHVLLAGDATAGSAAGALITVSGTLNSNGTFAQPVAISAFNPTDRWGGIYLNAAQLCTLNYTLLNHAGHTTGQGHTGRGPIIRLSGSSLNLDDSVLADGPAKAIFTSGTCNLNIRRSLIERMITGPELGDGAAMLCEDSNIQRILPDYRESNANVPDDEDCMYIHNGTGRSVIMRRSVFARCGDDVFDGLGGPLVVEDSILREGWDKGMSLLNNDLTITRTQIINCDKAIVPKSQNADTRTVTANFVTIVSQNHDTTQAPWGYSVPPSSPDADTPSTGFYTQNKAGQSNAAAILAINAKNCIVIAQAPVLVDAPYTATPSVLTYCDTALLDYSNFTWPGTGNISANPLFANTASGNYRITSTSPCRDTGDPATTDPDTTRGDMGALYFGGGAASGGSVNWIAATGPYRVTANTTVPVGTTLNIGPGTAVYFEKNVRFTVNGRILAQGTPQNRITMSHVPGTQDVGDSDPIKNGVQTGPAKWGGLRIVGSISQENVVQCVDFINAQGINPTTTTENDQENWGSLGSIRSWVWVDNCSWTGSHLRWCYGRCAKLTVSRCNFQDMFDPTEFPVTGFVGGTDNRQEPLKVEYVTTDTALSGNANFANGFPVGGWFRVYGNTFHGNKGHNDVFDGDGGRAGLSFPMDCRYNYFAGASGDEHIDLKGDALVANNIFGRATKDDYTIDTGYSNIVSGDAYTVAGSSDVTIMFARNLVYDVDHVVNCKAGVATIVEHNTIADMHGDFHYNVGGITQDVFCSVVNLIVLNDGTSPPNGFGCYIGQNIISGVPRLVNGADTTQINTVISHAGTPSKLEFNNNLVDHLITMTVGIPGTTTTMDTSIGAAHPGTIFTYGTNIPGQPQFTNRAVRDYSLKAESPARAAGPAGHDLGWTIPEWAYLQGGPSGTTDATTATFTVGGPGLIAFKYRLDGGAWTAPITIGTGAAYDRTATATVRTGTISLTGLTAGTHTLEVLGQDFASNWQDADPAKTYLGQTQFAPTARTWTVSPTILPLVINEVLAENVAAHNNSGTFPDYIEIYNPNTTTVSLNGWMLSDNPLKLNKFVFGAAATIAPGAYLLIYGDGPAATPGLHATFSLKGEEGEAVYLSQAGVVKDSVVYGRQIADYSIGRIGVPQLWNLNSPTPGAVNKPAPLGEATNVRITEWLASSEIRFKEDWVELFNPSTLPIALSGLALTDNVANAAYHIAFPPLSFMAPGYAKFTADASPSKGANHLNFQMNQFTDELALYSGSTQLQRLRVDPQITDMSQGLVTTGGIGGLTYFVLPTGALANGTADPAYANALAILNGLRITEIMYHHPLGDGLQYVELTNTGATTLNLAGVSFTDGIEFTFPTGFTLAAGAQCVVVSNPAIFIARYGSGTPIAGQFIGNLDNSGEPLALTLAPPFDANVLCFDYRGNWYATADGGGGALLLASNTTSIYDFSNRSSWTATAIGGSPAGLATQAPPQTSYPNWLNYYGGLTPLADEDFDGLDNLLEYSVGTDYTKSSTHQYLVPSVPPDDHLRVNFTLPQTSVLGGMGLPDIHYIIQAGNDLTGWTTIAEKLPTSATWTGTATITVGAANAGRVPLTVRDPQAITAQTRRFLCLKVETMP